MADVFISYAREDQAFVRRVFDALAEFGRETWVDWEGIPPSAVWMAEVRKAIEAGEAFVFVISPDSLASAVCREEVAHAASVNKRLIPILHRDVDDTPAPEAVAERNWIFIREQDDFERGIEMLLEAIAADPEWNEQHARLLVRAREWEQRRRPGSLLLRGDDLRDAERWLATAGGHEPAPTALHTAFVLASRRAAGRRQRITMGGVAFALVASLVLTVFALAQRSSAVHERERAEAAARVSRSRELAAQALGQLEVDPELGVLLALEAVEVQPTAEAEAALRESMAASQVRATLTGHQGSVLDVAFSRDGTRLLTIGFDGTARIWDASTGEEVAAASASEVPLTDASFSPDGSLVATASEDGTARIWDAEDGSPAAVLEGHEGVVTSLAFTPDGSMLVTGGTDGTVRLWSADGEALQAFTGHRGAVVDVAAAPEGLLASAGADGTVRLWDATGRPVAVLEGHRDEVTSVTFGPGGLLLSTSEDGSARLWSPAGRSLAVLEGHADDVVAGAIGPDGSVVATAGLDGTGRIWDAATGDQVAVLPDHDGQGIFDVGFSPDGARVVTTGDDGTARIWSTSTGEQLSVLRGHTEEVLAATFDPEGSRVATASGDGTAKIWDARGETLAIMTGHRGWIWDARWDDADERVTTAGRDGTARVWDASTGAEVARIDVSDQPVYAAIALPDGRLLTSGADGVMRMWEATTGRLLFKLEGHTQQINSVDVNDDGTRALTASQDATARLWDLEDGTEIAVLQHPPLTSVQPAIFGPGGTVITAKGGGARGLSASPIWIWDVSGSEPEIVRQLDGQRDDVKSILLADDGSLMLSVGGDPIVRIWDPSTGELIRELEGHSSYFLGADLSDDAGVALTVSEDDTARVWDVETGEALAVLRPLTGRLTWGDLSADGGLVAIGETTGVVRVWNVATGRELASFTGHAGKVWPTFDQTGERVMTFGDDGTARIFSCELCLRLPELVELAEVRVTRELTTEERAEFGV